MTWYALSIAENAGKYLKKGRQVYLEGTLVPNSWEDGEGTKHAGVKILAQTIEFLGAGSPFPKKQPVSESAEQAA